MKNWDVHGYNNEACNAWKEPEPDATKTAARQNLEKWLFYFDRFNNHEISARLDEELCSRTEEKMVEWQETSKMSWIEVRALLCVYRYRARSGDATSLLCYFICSPRSCATPWTNSRYVV